MGDRFTLPSSFLSHILIIIVNPRTTCLLVVLAESTPRTSIQAYVRQARDFLPGADFAFLRHQDTSEYFDWRQLHPTRQASIVRPEHHLLIIASISELRHSVAMRLSICTIVAALLAKTIAAPTSTPDMSVDVAERADTELERRDGVDGKYFHEPG